MTKSKETLRKKSAEIYKKSLEEPSTDILDYKLSLIKALNWYSANTDEKQIRAYTINYLKENGLKDKIKLVNSADYMDMRIIGILGRIVSNGEYLSDEDKTRISNQIDKLSTPKEVIVDIVKPNKPSIQDRIQDKAIALAEPIEDAIDEVLKKKKTNFDVTQYLVSNEINGTVAKKIGEYFIPLKEELEEAVNKTDEYSVESYSHITARHLKTFYTFVCNIIDTCTTTSKRVTRKPRVVKDKPVKLDKVQYAKTFGELNLKSIDPSKILNSKELWAYDTVKRKLIVLKGSLTIKGTTVSGIEESLVKTIRKPEEFFAKLTFGRRALDNAWKSIRGKTGTTTGRLNENMVLLTVF